MNSSRDMNKMHYPHLKSEQPLSSTLRKSNIFKKDPNFPTLNDLQSKFKTNADFNLFNDSLDQPLKQNPNLISRASIKYAGSEILKSFDFALNPVLTNKFLFSHSVFK